MWCLSLSLTGEDRKGWARKKERGKKSSFAWCLGSGSVLTCSDSRAVDIRTLGIFIQQTLIHTDFVPGPVLGAGNTEMNKMWSLPLRIYVNLSVSQSFKLMCYLGDKINLMLFFNAT